MDIAEVRINALDGFSVKYRLQTKHAVSRRVLRTDVDDVVIRTEEAVLLRLQVAVLVNKVLKTIVGLYIVLEGVLIVKLLILAEWITLEVIAQEQAAHIGMTYENDSEEVVNLALQQIGHLPDI